MQRIGIAVLVVCTALGAQGQGKYNSLLWRVTGNGLREPSHLYGTMHVSDKVAFHLSEEFFDALTTSRTVALEMDPEQWLGEMRGDGWFAAFNAANRSSGGSDDLYGEAFALSLVDRAVFTKALARDPEVVNDLLYRFATGSGNHSEDTYLDLFIYQCAKRTGKRAVGLEDMQHSVKQLMAAMLPDERKPDQEAVRRRRERSKLLGDPQHALEDCYRSQDLDRMDTVFDITSVNDRMRKYVIDERNELFAANMLPLLQDGKAFIGVGAMHLPGKNGLVEMLRARGYTVEPVKGNVTSRSRGQQRDMEKLYQPVQWRTVSPSDGAFTMQLPADLWDLAVGDKKGAMLVAADVVNGSHFTVQRIPTYAAVLGKDAEHVMQQLDSALYEGVPGRIVEHARIRTNNGWPGWRVHSVDRMGRSVHTLAVVGPFEVFLFKRTMRDLPQANKDGERAFASITFNAVPPATDARWVPSYGGCSVDMPRMRYVREHEPAMSFVNTAVVERLCEVQALDEASGESFLFLSSFFPDGNTVEQDTFELNMLSASFAKGIGATASSTSILVDGGLGLDATAVLPGRDTLRYRVVIDGARYDLLLARATADRAQRYFNSYQRTPYSVPERSRLMKDTLLHFSAEVSTTRDVLMDRVQSFADELRQIIRANVGKREDHLHLDLDQLYRSSSAPEAVSVHFERFHRFITLDDEDAFWKERTDAITGNGRLRMRDHRMAGERERRTVDFVVSDSASSRSVRVHMHQCPGALFTLKAVVDADGRTSPWVDAFFNTFKPDTTFSEGVFVPKGSTLLAWLSGADSTRQAWARNSFYQCEFDDADAPALMAYINGAEARDPENGRRDRAIGALGSLHHPDVLPFLLDLHRAAGDSVATRLTVLRALAEQRTKESTRHLARILIEDPPLTEDDWLITDLFRGYYDSLVVAKGLFPALWELLIYPEFEGPVITLAAALVSQGHLTSADIAPRKGMLLTKAKAELKRAIAVARTRQAQDYRDEDDEQEVVTWSSQNYVWGNDLSIQDETSIIEDHGMPDAEPWMTPLDAYQRLLLPFKKEPEIMAFYRAALDCGADDVAWPTLVRWTHEGMVVDASAWKVFMARDDSRMAAYRTLRALGKQSWFEQDRLQPEQNARAYYLSGWTTHAKDSVVVVGQRDVITRLGSGTLYYFLSQRPKDDGKLEWTLACTGPFAAGQKEPFAHKFILLAEESVLKLEDLDKAKEKLTAQLRYMGRTRWREQESSDRMSYYED